METKMRARRTAKRSLRVRRLFCGDVVMVTENFRIFDEEEEGRSTRKKKTEHREPGERRGRKNGEEERVGGGGT